ncbi:MAG: PAS domain S-box protein [Telmatospirillum sp.]|nr:PAS domain S-box protein [Telmatospirillum sp.]
MEIDVSRMLVEDSPDAFVVVSLDGRVLHWSRRAVDMFGFEVEEALDRLLTDLIVPSWRVHEERRNLTHIIETGAGMYETLRQRKDGSLLYVAVTGRRVQEGEGILSCVLLAKKDVTQLKVRRDAKLVEARFREILESMPDGIVISNMAGRIVYANGQAGRLFGRESAVLVGLLVEDLLPPSLREAHLRHRIAFSAQPRARAMGQGSPLFGLKGDGTEFPIEISLSPLITEEGVLVLSAARDVTERWRAERKFRAFLESAPDAIVIVNRAGEIVQVNSQTERLFGYDRADLLGRAVEMLIPESARDRHPIHRDGFFGDPKARPMGAGLELYGRRSDGVDFPAEISLAPIVDGGEDLVSAAIRDISDRRRDEQALREKNTELAAANRAKDRIFATMSEELRTPLTAIIGFTGSLLMRSSGALNEEQDRQLRTVKLSASHLLSLIDDLLDAARIESGAQDLRLERLDIGALVTELIASLRPEAEAKGIALDVITPPARCLFPVDRKALSRIVLNLAGHAVKVTRKGRVEVSLAETRREGRRIAEIAIADDGPGIREGDFERLFEPLARVDANGGDVAGVGLYLSRRLAARMGGRIEVRGRSGEGSLFTLSLPEPVL